jgi:hypothetical protein
MAVTTCSSSFNSSNRNIFFFTACDVYYLFFPLTMEMSSKAPEVSLLEMKISPYYGFGEGITI